MASSDEGGQGGKGVWRLTMSIDPITMTLFAPDSLRAKRPKLTAFCSIDKPS
jgi:hypothetical protein